MQLEESQFDFSSAGWDDDLSTVAIRCYKRKTESQPDDRHPSYKFWSVSSKIDNFRMIILYTLCGLLIAHQSLLSLKNLLKK